MTFKSPFITLTVWVSLKHEIINHYVVYYDFIELLQTSMRGFPQAELNIIKSCHQITFRCPYESLWAQIWGHWTRSSISLLNPQQQKAQRCKLSIENVIKGHNLWNELLYYTMEVISLYWTQMINENQRNTSLLFIT